VEWHRERDFADMVVRQPKTMYLSDGGVWNNIGTDWFVRARRTQLALPPDSAHLGADRFVVIDASAPTVTKERLWYLTFPWFAELGSIFRTLKAFSASTVLARVDSFREEMATTGAEGECAAVVRIVDRVSDDDAWPVPCWYERRPALRRRLPIDKSGLEIAGRWFVRNCDDLFRVNSRVPTTLFGIRPEVALGLVTHGYCATRVALVNAGLVDGTAWPMPPLTRFGELVGVPVTERSAVGWVVGRRQESVPSALVAQLARPIDELLRSTSEVSSADALFSAVHAEIRESNEARQRMLADGDARRSRHARLRQASKAYREGNNALAIEIYAECDESGPLDALQLLMYATALGTASSALGAVSSAAGLAVAVRAEAAAVEENSELLSSTWFAYLLARCYAVNGDAEQAVSSLRRVTDADWVSHLPPALSSDPSFGRIRSDAILIAFLDDVSARTTT
jgi:hypothetical protein